MAFVIKLGKKMKYAPHMGRILGGSSDRTQIKCYKRYSSGSGSKTTRIGCASGFWGDTAVSAPQLIYKGKIDFLVFDYLSEITMSLLTAVKQKVPKMGYTPDFVQVAMAPNIAAIKSKGIRVVSNAGGVNPFACAEALEAVAEKAGVKLNVAVVTGDDLMPQKEEIMNEGIKDTDSGISFPKTVTSMTAYLGGGAISKALDMGADVVITGRCTDSALVLGPLMHQYKWSPDSYDLMACGSIAGHLIECGAQVTGGIFTDWHKVPDWHNIGFPVVEFKSDGDFFVTKPPGTGGIVSPATCAEQLLYEIGDPQNYILPDVNCDFSGVSFSQMSGVDSDSVKVTGCKGKSPTPDYKVCATYAEGYRLTCVFPVGGPRAAAKGRRTAEEILLRVKAIHKMLKMEDFTKVHLQVLGTEDTYGPHAKTGEGPREVVVWLAVHHNDKKALEILAREIAPAGTGLLTLWVSHQQYLSPVMKLFSFLYPKESIKIKVHMNGDTEDYTPNIPARGADSTQPSSQGYTPPTAKTLPKGNNTFRLEDLAYTRSGDKGNNCNIGVVARHASYVPYLRAYLTAEAVDKYMSHVFEDHSGTVQDRVIRYEVPGVNGFNFLLKNSLGGGGVSSLRSDPQGKAYGQMLLDFTLSEMPTLEEMQAEL